MIVRDGFLSRFGSVLTIIFTKGSKVDVHIFHDFELKRFYTPKL